MVVKAEEFAKKTGRLGEVIVGYARLGKGDGSGVIVADSAYRKVYYYDQDGNQVPGIAPVAESVYFPALNNPQLEGVRIRLGYPNYNPIVLHVLGYDTGEGLQATGGITPGEQYTAKTIYPSVGNITNLRIAPLETPVLSVFVGATPYYDADGNFKVWGGASLDIDDVQALIDALASGEHQMVLVCLDPAADDAVLITNTASEGGQSDKDLFDWTTIETDMTIDPTYIPAGAFHIYEGQTEVTEADIYRSADPRIVFGKPMSSGGAGTVTSVAETTDASYLEIGGSPIITAGTITINKKDGLTANQVVATPNGAPGKADLRALVAADLPNTAVTPGSYTNTALTVDQQGRLTAASSGTAPVTNVTASSPLASSGGATPDISLASPITAAYLADYFRVVLVSTFTNVDIASAPAAIDGVTLSSGDRILLANQTTSSQRGIWQFNGAGNALSRTLDFASGSTTLAPKGLIVLTLDGALNVGQMWRLDTAGVTIDTSAQTWLLVSITIGPFGGLRGASFRGQFTAAAYTADRQFTFPDVSMILAGRNVAQTFTNQQTFDEGIIVNESGANSDTRMEGDTDVNLLFLDASTDRVGVGTNTPSAKLNVEGAVNINDAGAAVSVRIGSDTDPANFYSAGTSDNIGVGTDSPNANTKLHVVSTAKNAIALPVMTATQQEAITGVEGAGAYRSDTEHIRVWDGQRYRNVNVAGWLPYAYPIGFNFSGDYTANSLTLAANGGSVAIPIFLSGHMLLGQVVIRNNNVASARTWQWDLYEQYLNNGNSGENTLTRVATGTAAETFTPGAGTIRGIVAASAPVYLPPGTYWLVIQCQHATNNFALGDVAGATGLARNVIQTKTTTNPNGSTLDFVAATWTKSTVMPGVRLEGRVFGETTVF